VSTGFVLLSPDDPVLRLRTSFPEFWSDLLEYADADTPYLLYSAFGNLLLQRRNDADLWKRAYRFFDDVADKGTTADRDLLTQSFDRLWDSDMKETVEENLGSSANLLFQCSKL
jgi:hypothetical protein